jgi:hypothetical protein
MRILMFLVLIFMSGCSVLAPQEDKLAKEVSRGVEDLCKEIDKINRERFLEKVNAELSGQMILVDCGD